MGSTEPIFVLGGGAIGLPLAAYLTQAGRPVVAVRTSRADVLPGSIMITLHNGANRLSVAVETVSLARLAELEGTIVIAAKSHANQAIASALVARAATGPIVILQNGVGVETPFLNADFPSIYRCVLYVTSQAISECDFTIRPVTASPIGIIRGDERELQTCVARLTTDQLPFRAEGNIQREIWKKAILNAVFNSVCPLLDADNGIFVRSAETAQLARELVRECVALTDRLDLGLSEAELMEQLMLISRRADGQLISTLQDLKIGRQTEIEFLNLEIARVAASLYPRLDLPRIELLGRMIIAKEREFNTLHRSR